ncbi:response regulator [Shewanella sp. WXL01]|uniref:Response regulator n=1 Tax=Shewanella maritima TaxID=2520507 RepID=A0A411PJK2_9GAMM|nr:MULTISPECIES: response regulator [Shewanella]NKF51416.1 response regulator [Shewanella sp. WXL01]QBF83668.1 response regulator [Shewanella maritima]
MFTQKEAHCLKRILVESINAQRAMITCSENEFDEEQEQVLINLVSVHNKIKMMLNKLNKQPHVNSMPRILIVDDADSMLQVTTKILVEMGFTKVDMAKSAERALTMLLDAAKKKAPYQLVLTDWEMEGKTGLDLLKDIRVSEQLLETDVYIISSHNEQSHILQAIQSGVTGYLLKPLNFKALAAKLTIYLPAEAKQQTQDKQSKRIITSPLI